MMESCISQSFHTENPGRVAVIAAIPSNVMKQKWRPLSLPWLCLYCPLTTLHKLTAAKRRLPNGGTRTMTLTHYLSRQCMKDARTTAASLVSEDYNKPVADDREANVSVYVCNDVEIFQATTLGMKRMTSYRPNPGYMNNLTNNQG